jgi:hypothetical protein
MISLQLGAILGLGVAAAWAGSAWYAYEAGADNREASLIAKHTQEINKRDAALLEFANIERQAAIESERKRQAASVAAMSRRHVLELDIERKANERIASGAVSCSCDLDPKSYSLLLESIRSVNNGTARIDSSTATGRMPPSVPGDTGTGKRE